MIQRLLRGLVAFLCGWEVVALTTGDLPTLSSLVWRLPRRVRVVLCAVITGASADHFVTRRWL